MKQFLNQRPRRLVKELRLRGFRREDSVKAEDLSRLRYTPVVGRGLEKDLLVTFKLDVGVGVNRLHRPDAEVGLKRLRVGGTGRDGLLGL